MTPSSLPVHLAIVDDEVELARVLHTYLVAQGYRVTALQSGRELMSLMAADPPALVLLDLGLPGEDGFAIARQLREHYRCGLVIVTGRGDSVDKVVGLEVGADDYVTKPFELRELAARIKAVLRRLSPQGEPGQPAAPMRAPAPSLAAPAPAGAPEATREKFRFEGWQFDMAARRLLDPRGEEVFLTTGEFDLLGVLVHHPGRVLSRDFLLEQTRGRDAGPFDRTIDVQIGRLRKKIELNPERPELIKSVRGAGYVLTSVVTSA
jgi:DNA-binding response OmpR family regulator